MLIDAERISSKSTMLTTTAASARRFLATSTATKKFVQTSELTGYESTIHNMSISSQTRVICQGFTGKQVRESAAPPTSSPLNNTWRSSSPFPPLLLGHISLEASDRVWYKHGWWCVAKQGRPNAFGVASVQHGARGKSDQNGRCTRHTTTENRCLITFMFI